MHNAAARCVSEINDTVMESSQVPSETAPLDSSAFPQTVKLDVERTGKPAQGKDLVGCLKKTRMKAGYSDIRHDDRSIQWILGF